MVGGKHGRVIRSGGDRGGTVCEGGGREGEGSVRATRLITRVYPLSTCFLREC